MSSRVTVPLGLLAGAVVAGLVIAAVVAFGPLPHRSDAGATPSPAANGPSASPTGSGGSPGVPSPSPGGVASAPPSDAAFALGKAAPPLTVPKLGGGTINLADLRGRPVWIDFMTTTSAASVADIPEMSSLALRYADAGLVVIAIDVREDASAVAAFRDRLQPTFPFGLDRGGKAQKAWGVPALPSHYWIDRSGIVRAAAPGGLGPDAMAANLAQILPGVTVSP